MRGVAHCRSNHIAFYILPLHYDYIAKDEEEIEIEGEIEGEGAVDAHEDVRSTACVMMQCIDQI